MRFDRGGRVREGVPALAEEGEGFICLFPDKSPKQISGLKINERILLKLIILRVCFLYAESSSV